MKPQERQTMIEVRRQQAAETLADAQRLLQDELISSRTIVNRAYYAVFYGVLALLQSAGKVTRKHSGAIAMFDMHFIQTGQLPKELSRILHELFEDRMEDDYARIEPIERAEAARAVTQAQEFLTTLFNYMDSKEEQSQ